MPRKKRCRRVCEEPDFPVFRPAGRVSGGISMTVDEFETIRLVDYEQKTHEECAALMDVSRTTVTEIYQSARAKIADALVNGKKLVISGGEYRLCGGEISSCLGICRRAAFSSDENKSKKGDKIMKIAVTYDNGQIYQHFGHTEKFKIYEVENGAVISAVVADTEGQGHGALASFLAQKGVDTLICGGIGGGARMALAAAGIKLYGGVSGECDAAVNDLLGGTLEYDPDIECAHHDGEHKCGDHGEHKCCDHDGGHCRH